MSWFDAMECCYYNKVAFLSRLNITGQYSGKWLTENNFLFRGVGFRNDNIEYWPQRYNKVARSGQYGYYWSPNPK